MSLLCCRASIQLVNLYSLGKGREGKGKERKGRVGLGKEKQVRAGEKGWVRRKD